MVRRIRWHCRPDTVPNSSPGGMRLSTLLLGHGGSPQYWIGCIWEIDRGFESIYSTSNSVNQNRWVVHHLQGTYDVNKNLVMVIRPMPPYTRIFQIYYLIKRLVVCCIHEPRDMWTKHFSDLIQVCQYIKPRVGIKKVDSHMTAHHSKENTEHHRTKQQWSQHRTSQHSTAQLNTTLYFSAQHSTMQPNDITFHHSIRIQWSTMQHSTAQCSPIQYSTPLYNSTQYNTAYHSTVQHSKTQIDKNPSLLSPSL